MKVVKRNESKTWFIVAFEGEFRTENHNVIYTGPGKVNAAMATQWLIDNHHPSEIINVGTAGGNPSQVDKGLVYVIKRAIDFFYENEYKDVVSQIKDDAYVDDGSESEFLKREAETERAGTGGHAGTPAPAGAVSGI